MKITPIILLGVVRIEELEQILSKPIYTFEYQNIKLWATQSQGKHCSDEDLIVISLWVMKPQFSPW